MHAVEFGWRNELDRWSKFAFWNHGPSWISFSYIVKIARKSWYQNGWWLIIFDMSNEIKIDQHFVLSHYCKQKIWQILPVCKINKCSVLILDLYFYEILENKVFKNHMIHTESTLNHEYEISYYAIEFVYILFLYILRYLSIAS